MPWYMIVGRTLLSSLASMGTALLTETFLKQVIVEILSKIVVRTKTEEDDKILQAIKKTWGVE